MMMMERAHSERLEVNYVWKQMLVTNGCNFLLAYEMVWIQGIPYNDKNKMTLNAECTGW